jgi:hypothetical protein
MAPLASWVQAMHSAMAAISMAGFPGCKEGRCLMEIWAFGLALKMNAHSYWWSVDSGNRGALQAFLRL